MHCECRYTPTEHSDALNCVVYSGFDVTAGDKGGLAAAGPARA